MAEQNQNNQFGSPLQDQPPQNLPTGRGLPPLASASQRPSPTSKLETGPEDILDEVDKTKPEIEGPAMSGPDLSAPMRPAVALPEKAEMREPFIKQHKKIFVAIGLVVMIGGVLALGGWYGYQLFFAGSFESLGQSVNLSNTQSDINQALNLNQPAVNQNLNPEPPPQPLDTDRDGLTDEEEALYGTALTQVDSDSDGLTDRDEVKVFEIDPNNADTDADGYSDGEEVRAGYEPKGPGRLLQIE